MIYALIWYAGEHRQSHTHTYTHTQPIGVNKNVTESANNNQKHRETVLRGGSVGGQGKNTIYTEGAAQKPHTKRQHSWRKKETKIAA